MGLNVLEKFSMKRILLLLLCIWFIKYLGNEEVNKFINKTKKGTAFEKVLSSNRKTIYLSLFILGSTVHLQSISNLKKKK